MQVTVQVNPLSPETRVLNLSPNTVLALAAQANLPTRYGLPRAVLWEHGVGHVIPLDNWARVRLKPGARLSLDYEVEGPVAVAALGAIVSAAAPTLATMLLGAAATPLLTSLVAAGISALFMLAANALIPPPDQPDTRRYENFTITGTQNAINPWGVLPKVLGRHFMYPPLTATGYTETETVVPVTPPPDPPPVFPVGWPGVVQEFANRPSENTTLVTSWEPEVEEEFEDGFEPPRDFETPETVVNILDHESQSIFWVGRMTFGTGPLCLEDIRIGTTPITEFSDEDVQIEFLNVDQAATLARVPDLASKVVGWRSGGEALSLYSRDVTADGYNVELLHDQGQVRTSRVNTQRAEIDVDFPQGLGHIKRNGELVVNRGGPIELHFEYRKSGDLGWIDGGVLRCRGKSRSLLRYTHRLSFPEVAQWDIRITRLSPDRDGTDYLDDSFLTQIRSIGVEDLPSHPDIAEMAIRLKAGPDLNNQVNAIGATVRQMAPVWDGTQWSTPVEVRHPAWMVADLLRGVQQSSPVADAKIDLAGLKAWADEEPHWTCDFVIDTEMTGDEVMRLICAAGRARHALDDRLRYSVIRETDSAVVRGLITPRNSWGFSGQMVFPRDLHGFRCEVLSERAGWQRDEVMVYADGYSAANATEVETLELPGVVVPTLATDEGNVYRLARYHMAAAQLRRERFSVSMDWESLPYRRGHVVKLQHEAAKIGAGAAAVTSVVADGSGFASRIRLDDVVDVTTACRMTIRKQSGEVFFFTATPDLGAPYEWDVVTPGVAAADIQDGDLAVLELTELAEMLCVITGIERGAEEEARLHLAVWAPEILQADSGLIPPFVPNVTDPDSRFGPVAPVVSSAESSVATTIRQASETVPRIAVFFDWPAQVSNDTRWRLRWADADSLSWTQGELRAPAATLFTDALEIGRNYIVEVRAEDSEGRSRGWVRVPGSYTAVVTDPPSAPVGWRAEPGYDCVRFSGPPAPGSFFQSFCIFGATAADADTLHLLATPSTPAAEITPPAGITRYRVGVLDRASRLGTLTDWLEASPLPIGPGALSPDVWADIAEDATDIANGLLTQFQTDVIDPIVATFPPIQVELGTLGGRIENLAVEQRSAAEIAGDLQESVLWALLRTRDNESRMRDAGVYVDPEDGSVRIAGLDQVAGRVSEAEIELDAQRASIELRATYAEIEGMIAEAVFDPDSFADFSDLQLRMQQAEIDIDALDGAIALKADAVAVDGIDARLVSAEADIDALEATITLKVDTADFDAVETRLQSAEIEISALDGPAIRAAVADTRHLQEEVDLSSVANLDALMELYRTRQALRTDIAFASQDLRALVDEDRTAIAELSQTLGASIDENGALIRTEQQARAEADLALASSIQTLEAEATELAGGVAGNSTAITEINVRVTDAEGELVAQSLQIDSLSATLTTAQGDITGNATAIGGLTTRVTDAEGEITTQASQIASLSADLSTAQGDITGNATAISGLDVRVTDAEGDLVSQAAQITSLTASVGQNAADISAEATARTTADDALAATISTVQADVGGLEASVATQSTAIATLEGNAEASFGLRVEAGGAGAGLELVALDDPVSGPASALRVNADNILLDGTVQAHHINVQSLSAISATIGTFQTSATGERVVISDDVIAVYDANDTLRVKLGDLS